MEEIMRARDEQAVLFANEAFYIAFAAGDVTAMERIWARAAPVACLHPGAPPLRGRAEVMDSWRAILTSPSRPDISCHEARAFVTGESAFVLCYERIEQGWLLASNLFLREEGEWRMIHHHAGPAPGRPETQGGASGPADGKPRLQ